MMRSESNAPDPDVKCEFKNDEHLNESDKKANLRRQQSAPAGQSAVVPPPCPFCQLSAGAKQDQEILYRDAEFFVVADVKPHALHHYLVVPHEHIGNAKTLVFKHISLVNRMVEVGTQVLRDRYNGDTGQARYGFHWPPVTSVDHLHMHVLCPVDQMTFFDRNLLFKPGLYFVTPGYMIERLLRMNPDQQAQPAQAHATAALAASATSDKALVTNTSDQQALSGTGTSHAEPHTTTAAQAQQVVSERAEIEKSENVSIDDPGVVGTKGPLSQDVQDYAGE